MEKRNYADRFKMSCTPGIMESFGNGDNPWSEDEETVNEGLAWGEEKERLLKWVRKQMRRRLTEKQRTSIALYYFKDMTYVEIGKKMGCAPSSACRSVHRGIQRLREAARVDPPAHLKSCRRSTRRVTRKKLKA
tara:strand:- start:635 stop:1036 length:402 start_codon:yes stop_codon:yes gene_type:complete